MRRLSIYRKFKQTTLVETKRTIELVGLTESVHSASGVTFSFHRNQISTQKRDHRSNKLRNGYSNRHYQGIWLLVKNFLTESFQ